MIMIFRWVNNELESPAVSMLNLYEYTDQPTYKTLTLDIYTYENGENSMYLVSSYIDGITNERNNVLYRHDIQYQGYNDGTILDDVILAGTCSDALKVHESLIVIGCNSNQRIIFVERSTM